MLKKYNHIKIFLIILLFILSSCILKTDSYFPHQSTDIPVDKSVVYKRLSNGFRYVLMKNSNPESRISMHLYVQAGSLHEREDQQGAAHFLEHMLFNGTENFKAGELIKYFQSIGMQFGPDANGHTGFDETVYDLILPDPEPKTIQKALLVLKDYAQGALLEQSEIDKERKVILAEKRARDSASYRTFTAAMKFWLNNTLTANRFPIGKEDTILRIDQAVLKEFYHKWYRPDKMILVIVGDFDDPDYVDKAVKDKFINIKAKTACAPEPDLGIIKHTGIKPFYHFEKEAGNTTVSINIVENIPGQKDSIKLREEFITMNIADLIIQDRLNLLTHSSDCPFTSASIDSAGVFLKKIKYSDISAKTDPQTWKQSLNMIEQVLRKTLKYGFTKNELKRAKKNLTAHLETEAKKALTRQSSDIAQKIMDHIAENMVFMSPVQEKDMFTGFINSLSVQDVNKAFKNNWQTNHRLVIVTGNADLTKSKTKPKAQILKLFNLSTQKSVTKPVDSKTKTFPYFPEPENKGKIIKKTKLKKADIIQIDFANNVRLNLKKTNFKANEVLVQVNFGSGSSSQPDNLAGLAYLTQEVINESGIGPLTKQELIHALTGKSTGFDFSVKPDTFCINGRTVSNEVVLLFQLIHAQIKDPQFDLRAYKLVMQRFKQKYKKMASSIHAAMTLKGTRFLAGGDNRFGLPSYSKFKKLKLKNVRLWMQKPLKHAKLEVSVTGDFDKQAVINAAALYFGSLPKRKHIKNKYSKRTPAFPFGKTKKIQVKTKIPKGLLVAAYPTDDVWDIKKTRRLNILSEVFSERLRVRIREKLGAAYSPAAWNMPSRAYKGYGVFQVFITINPSQTSLVTKEVKQIASDIAKYGVSKNELKRALKPTITSIKDILRKNDYWLNQVLSGSAKHPSQLHWNKTILKDYLSINSGQISALAKKYLDNKKAAVIIVHPVCSKN